MASLQLKLLGKFEVISAAGQHVQIAGRKNQALLAYLAIHAGKKLPRDKLTGLLWSDRAEQQARSSLRQALFTLRRDLAGIEPIPLILEGDAIAIDASAASSDVGTFERLAASSTVDDMRQAAAVYGGDLLDSVMVQDQAFDEWLSVERSRLREIAIGVLSRLLERVKDIEAISTANRLIALDPLREASYRVLMRVFAAQGEREEAVRQYQACRDTLRRELDVEPSGETTDLYREIREGKYRPLPIKPSSRAATDGARSVTAEAKPVPRTRPSIAVLPFANMSGNPEQEYLSDGITDDIITELSRYRELLVIARSSCFQFRDKSVDVKRVGLELGVEYIVEGSLRKVGDRLRITAQLIEVDTGSHVWANRYDRSLEDVFAIQDELTQTIAATLVGQLAHSGAEKARRKPTENWAAYDYVLQATQCIRQYDTMRARSLLRRAIEIDPGYAHAHAILSWAYVTQFFEDVQWETIREALACAQKALALDGTDYLCHASMGYALTYFEQFDVAEIHLDKAVELNPNSIFAAGCRANLLARVGRTREALDIVDLSAQRDPLLADESWELRALILFQEKRYEEVIRSTIHKNSLQYWDHAYLAAAYIRLGREQEARAEAAEVLRMKPDFSILAYAKQDPFKNPANLNHILDAFRAAGLPE
jgi:TolB-like protein